MHIKEILRNEISWKLSTWCTDALFDNEMPTMKWVVYQNVYHDEILDILLSNVSYWWSRIASDGFVKEGLVIGTETDIMFFFLRIFWRDTYFFIRTVVEYFYIVNPLFLLGMKRASGTSTAAGCDPALLFSARGAWPCQGQLSEGLPRRTWTGRRTGAWVGGGWLGSVRRAPRRYVGVRRGDPDTLPPGFRGRPDGGLETWPSQPHHRPGHRRACRGACGPAVDGGAEKRSLTGFSMPQWWYILILFCSRFFRGSAPLFSAFSKKKNSITWRKNFTRCSILTLKREKTIVFSMTKIHIDDFIRRLLVILPDYNRSEIYLSFTPFKMFCYKNLRKICLGFSSGKNTQFVV